MVTSAAARWALLVVLSALASGPVAAAAAVETVDDSGHSVRRAQPAQRIVALTPHLTELLYAAGAGDAIVGAAAFSDQPPAARSIPRIGDARALDLERIVALQPDLVVAWVSGSPHRQLARLRALGLTVFENEPSDFDAIASTIERLGVLAGTSGIAQARAAEFRRELARIRASYGDHAPVRVFYQVADRPLVTVSSKHVIADALRVCGAVNVFEGARNWLPRPSREAVLLADPDAIVVAAPVGTDALVAWKRWTALRAVAAGRLYVVDPDTLHRATPRILEGVEALCGHIAQTAAGLANR
jgi:iron complex transport system substrate-binding protein